MESIKQWDQHYDLASEIDGIYNNVIFKGITDAVYLNFTNTFSLNALSEIWQTVCWWFYPGETSLSLTLLQDTFKPGYVCYDEINC